MKFVPTTVTLYSPSGSVPPTKPQSTVTQLPQPVTIQPASIPLPFSKMSTPNAQSTLTSLPAGTLQPPPTATESSEEEMPEEEDLTPATPAPSPVLRPTLLQTPVSVLKGKSPAQPPSALKKAKVSPANQPVRRSVRIAQQVQSGKCTPRNEGSTGATTHKHDMPGGLGTPCEADPDYDDLPDLISCADDNLNNLDDEIEDNFCYYQDIHDMIAEAI